MNPKANNMRKKPAKRGGTAKIPRILSAYDKEWAGVPAGGKWFNNAEMARSYIAKKYGVGMGFVLAWGLPGGGNWFGAYVDYTAAQSVILDVQPENRHGFEMICEGRPCSFYCDVEWIGAEDIGGEIRLRIANKIRSGFLADYGVDVALHTCYGSRITADGMKNSFHVVASGCMFTNNHGGAMRACAERIESTLEPADRGKIDMGVYDRNRVMRMVLSCKRGTPVPLRNITGDPFSRTATLYSDRVYLDHEPAALGNFSITHHVNDTNLVVVPGDIVTNSQRTRNKKSNNKMFDACEKELGTTTSGFPSNVCADLQALCDIERAKETCVVTGEYKLKNGVYFVKCRNNGVRQCIANFHGHTHESENAYLLLYDGHVQYRCFSSRCGKTFRPLGPFPESLKEFLADEKHITHEEVSEIQSDGEASEEHRDCETSSNDYVENEIQADGEHDAMQEDDEEDEFQADFEENTAQEDDEEHEFQADVEDQPDTEIKEKNVAIHVEHHPFPELHSKYLETANVINEKYLAQTTYIGKRVHVVESSCNTGKTKSVFDYAARINLKMICVSNRITQVDAHEAVIGNKGHKLERYDNKRLLRHGIGKSHIISTIDSLSKTVTQLRKHTGCAKRFGIFLDEYHSIVQYLYESTTLCEKRRNIIKDLQWLIRNAFKVIVADNTLSDHDFDFLESALSETREPVDLTFTINKFQTFEGTPAIFCEDRAEMLKMIVSQNDNNEGCVIACNTKSDANFIFEYVKANTKCPKRRANILMYDSNTKKNTNIPLDILEKWDGNIIIYSPKITTGLDFHPTKPTNVYFFVRGENTVCPATAVQMVTRTRNIKTLYICADRMRNKMRFDSEEHMNAALDSFTNMPEHAVLHSLGDVVWSSDILEDVYTDNKFSIGYRKYRWHHEIMVGSYVCHFISYLKKRGFVVTVQEPDTIIPIQDPSIRRDILDRCHNNLGDALIEWRKDIANDKSEYFDAILCKVRGIPNTPMPSVDAKPSEISVFGDAKARLKKQIQKFVDAGDDQFVNRVINIFLCDATLRSNQNMILAMYSREKLKQIQAHAHTLDYALPNAATGPACVSLLHDLIEVFNVDLPEPSRIKVSSLSLDQKEYDENEEIEITERMWGLFSYNCRAVKTQPTTRRGLMTVIFTLSQKIFGKGFTWKNDTTRRVVNSKNVSKQIKCYNYVANHLFLSVYVRLVDWSKHNISDFEPAMVSKYKLEQRQLRDVTTNKQIQDAQDLAKLKEKEELEEDQKLRNEEDLKLRNEEDRKLRTEEDRKRKAEILCICTQPKRRKAVVTAADSQKQDYPRPQNKKEQKQQLRKIPRTQKKQQIVEQNKPQEESKRKEFTLKKQAFVNAMHRNSKRHKIVELSTGVSAVATEYSDKGDQDAFERDRELSCAVYRQDSPNTHSDFI